MVRRRSRPADHPPGLVDLTLAHDDVPMGHLDIARVTFALPDGRVLLDEVSFKVAEGKVTALVGANGSGKTTLAKQMNGLLRPRRGTVTVAGELIGGRPVGDVARQVKRPRRAQGNRLHPGPPGSAVGGVGGRGA